MCATAWRDIRFPTCAFTCGRWGDQDGAGARIIHSVELNPGVLWLWSVEWRAPLSSLQSSLNLANRICYRCNGRNKGREAGIRRGFLEVAGCALKKLVCVCGLCVFTIFPWQKNPELPQHICLFPPQAENASPTPLCFSPVSAELYVTVALSFSLPSFLCFSAALVTTSYGLQTSLSLCLYSSVEERIIKDSIWCLAAEGRQL